MIVPQFWAESRLQHREKGKQVTVRRFGWSDSSQADAQSNADARVKEALARVLAGEKLPRRELKVAYNGADGLPIREEVVSRHGETVITRNSYGARCLNTPNVLFADIDFPDRAPSWFFFAVFAALILLAVAVARLTDSWGAGVALAVFALFVAETVSNAVYRALAAAKGGAEKAVRERITRVLTERPEWNLRLYRTPAGMRVAVTHKLFSPSEPSVREFFEALGTDPLYVTMCLNQQCFRARVSAKPWRIRIRDHLRPGDIAKPRRIGIQSRIGPRPGVWPVDPSRLPARYSWIAEYEEAAASYAACSFLESLGSGVEHPSAQSVLELHDELCRAHSNLPIA